MNEAEVEEAALPGRSYLVVDYGQSVCKTTLYDLVEGRYRLIGRGEGFNTAGPPWFDISYGLLQALGQLGDATGRKLMSLQGQLIRPSRSDGSGVDYFGATVTLGEPLRVAVAGLLESASIASARKALRAVYAQEVACFSLADSRGRPGQIETLLVQLPDVVFLVGGTDGGADKQVMALTTTIAMALELLDEAARPVVIYGGNAKLRPRVLAELAELTDVHLVDNVRPSFDEEEIGHAIAMLSQVYYTAKVGGIVSSGVLADWCNATPMSSAHAFGGIAEYFAAAGQGRVLGLDVGCSQVTLISAVQGRVDLAVRTDLGLGRPLQRLFDEASAAVEASWMNDDELADIILDKAAHPNAVPLTRPAAKAELAIAGQLVRRAVAEVATDWSWPADGSAPDFDTLLVRGRVFADAPQPADALLTVLDALQPHGVFKVVVDSYGVLPAMGLLAGEDPEMVVQILGSDALTRWGWVVAPGGKARPGETALTVSLQSKSLNAIQVEVPFGHVEIVPLPYGEKAKVELQPAASFDIGAGKGQSRQLTLSGGVIGLVIDGRGRRPVR